MRPGNHQSRTRRDAARFSDGGDRNRRAVTDAALQLGRALDLTVVAEGVEDQAEFDYRRHHECHAVQGYFIAKPMPHATFTDWLTYRPAPAPAIAQLPATTR